MKRIAALALAVACGGNGPGSDKVDTDPSTTDSPSTTDTERPSTTPDGCTTDAEQFALDVSPLLQRDCVVCHVEGGLGAESRNVLKPATEADHLEYNRGVLTPLALETVDALPRLVAKAIGDEGHGGGPRIAYDDADFAALMAFAARAEAPGGCEDPDGGIAFEVPPSPLRRLSAAQLENTLADLFPGVVMPPSGIQPDPLVHGFDNNAVTQAATALQIGQFHSASLAATTAAMAAPGSWLTCSLEPADAPCIEAFLLDFGARAFRRPLTSEESEAFTGFYDDMLALDGDPAAALQLTLQAFLNSPSFLHLVELGADDLAAPGDRVALDGHQIAARLSYFLWNTMPDEALFAAAADGSLGTADGVEAQAWRLLADPKAERAVANFHRLWLELDEIEHIDPNGAYFPTWQPVINDGARAEIDTLVWQSAFGPEPTLATLLTSRQATLTPELAAVYRASAGEVELPAAERSGFLTRAGWLGATSHEVYASPIQRGVFVLERLLCVPPPAPPGDVDTALDMEAGEAVTNRDRYAQHSSDPACFGCHEAIDGIGFGFEHYDAIGAYRDFDNGQPVDASGEFVDGDLDGITFDGAIVMSEYLATSESVHRCSATQWYRYAMGRTETLDDQPTLDALTDAYWGTGGELPQLLVDIVRTENFRTRRAE